MKKYRNLFLIFFLLSWYLTGMGQNLDVDGTSIFRLDSGLIFTANRSGPGWSYLTQDFTQWDMYPVNGHLGMAIAEIGTPDLQRFRITEAGTLAVNKGQGGAKGGLHIKQLNAASSTDGIFLEHPSNGNAWNTFISDANDLLLSYNGNPKAYFDHTDGSHHALSDQKLKEDVQSISSILSTIGKLNPVTYKFKSNPDAGSRSWGFIAQEVEAIFPDFVKECEGYKTIAYDNFAVIAIKAIQEQQAQIEALKQALETLR